MMGGHVALCTRRHRPVRSRVAAVRVRARARAPPATAEPTVTPESRAATLTFAPGVTPNDKAWILGAIATARPEAQRLIAEVDGMIEVRTDLNAPGSAYPPGAEQAIGLTHMVGDHAMITLDVRELDGERAIDRNIVVLHELGHVIDLRARRRRAGRAARRRHPRGGDVQRPQRRRRRVHGDPGALRRHVRQVGAARPLLARRLRLRHPDAPVSGGLGHAARAAWPRSSTSKPVR